MKNAFLLTLTLLASQLLGQAVSAVAANAIDNLCPPEPCYCLGGRFTAMELYYFGDNNVNITAYADLQLTEPIVSFAGVNNGELLNISGAGLPGGVLSSVIYLRTIDAGGVGCATRIYAQCPTNGWPGSAEDLRVLGKTYGPFTVFAHTYAHNNYRCSVSGSAQAWMVGGNLVEAGANTLGTRNAEPLVFITGDAPRGVIGADGNFGIGTQAPGAKLHVAGDGMVDNNLNIGENLYVGDALEVAGMARIAGFTHIDNDALVSGNAQISGALEVNGEAFIEGFTEINDNAQVNGNAQVRGELLLGPAQEARLAQTGVDLLIESQSGNVNIEADNELMMTVSNVEVEVKKRLIVTGADLAERFTVTDGSKQAIPGYVMAIDTEHPGALVVSRKAYNRAVAGIVSGAGGVNTAMLLGQEGTLADGDVAVAITGRVYCYADADGGAIAPGDLLTTAELPGHVMKAQDYERAQGAIVGKAMTPLAEGQGLVLVLITLQ